MDNQNIIVSKTVLPNAPLVEVVFELRWRLQGDPQTPPPFLIDPGYPILVSNFITAAGRYGFKKVDKIAKDGMLTAHSIGMRLYKTEDEPFPLWQIGPGIFASNESAAYTWSQFKKTAIDGIKVVLSSYPKIKGFDFKPIHMELRYIDSFDRTFIAHQDLLKFINETTSLKIDLPSFCKKRPLKKSPTANLKFEFPISNLRNSNFSFRIADGKIKGSESMLLESGVITRSDSINFGKTLPRRLQFINDWLEAAHNLTSPFFKEFVSQSLMKKFERPPNASA